MKVYGKCKSCNKEIGYSTNVNTRVEFAIEEGERKILNCKKCKRKIEFHVDELYAKDSKIAQLIAGVVFLIGTPLIFFCIKSFFLVIRSHYVIYIVSGFLLVPSVVYRIIKKGDQVRVNSFNRSYLKGRIHNLW